MKWKKFKLGVVIISFSTANPGAETLSADGASLILDFSLYTNSMDPDHTAPHSVPDKSI